jgi:signal transduction histidine kinase/ActR/RegA family two-component response regulator
LNDDRVLILAPRGRDAAVARDLLERNCILAEVCPHLDALVAELSCGAGAVLVTEEALAASPSNALTRFVADQPAWSDLPFVVLANGARGPRSQHATQRLEDLGNMVLLERPLHAEAMVGAIRSALKARRRQYEVRDVATTLERLVAERTQELATAREGLEIALEAAELGSWDIDLTTGEGRRTDRLEAIFGLSGAAQGWSVTLFLSHVVAAQRDTVSAAFEEAIASGSLDLECAIRTREGVQRWITAKGRVRYDASGMPARMSGVVADVTERRDAEEKLAQAQKMDAIGQLTGGVAHDFNNLLTPIVGSLDLLRRHLAEDDRSQRWIGGAMQAAERAATLTQRLLAFARRQSLQPQAVDVGALIDGIVDLIRRTLGPTVTVLLEVPRHLPFARVDPNQLELALLNLAINARDAMPGGGRLTLTIGSTTVDERNALDLGAGNYVRVTATDTGVGMDRDTLSRATEPFFSTKGVGKGTGLGLSMVHGLAAQSGGTLQIASEPGKGTSVIIWLPATERDANAGLATIPDTPVARRSARILLVDDEEIVRTVTADMLRDIGYDVVEFGSGSQALAALRGGLEADALVSDYLMPGMTGAALVEELRQNRIRLPALLITGYANAGEDVPADLPILAKPFKQVDLVARIDALLRRPDHAAAKLRVV